MEEFYCKRLDIMMIILESQPNETFIEMYCKTCELDCRFRERVSELENKNLTALSIDFWELIDKFEWNGNEKDLFIKEMLALSPNKRQATLNRMIKSKSRGDSIEL